ncbi:MAG TPA: hypothetical protein PKN08_12680 [Opitutaceae bacterium]|nr:hypothetical protein [Opitutaceae bacterium]
MISSVSLDHLEQAWQTLMPARPEGQPKGKARWNEDASRDFTRDCGELATLIVQSIDSEFSAPPMGHATLRLAIVMHRAFKDLPETSPHRLDGLEPGLMMASAGSGLAAVGARRG